MRARVAICLSRHSARQSDLGFALTPRPSLPRVPCPSHTASVRAQALRVGLSSPSPGAGAGAGAEDPLIAFLERNQEDAALMLAMWTSLRRCCLHASEISESLSLGARWFLHHLIHRRAIAAAVGFYHRLVELGVQLQRWDVAVLLSSLPYERAGAGPADDTQWARRNARATTRRSPRARGERETNSVKSEGGEESAKSGGGEESAKSEGGEESAARERVRRWALYEASMGHVELRSEDSASSNASTSCVGDALRAQLRHLMLLDEAAPREIHATRILLARRRRYAAEALRVVLRFLRAEDARGALLASKDCALFFRLAATSEPWRRRTDVEQFVARAVASRLSDSAAEHIAAQAIWRAHLCRVRAVRPGDYESLAHACGAAAALPAAVRAAASLAKIAVSHVRVEIARERAKRRSVAATAASIRSGAFVDSPSTATWETNESKDGEVNEGAGEEAEGKDEFEMSRRDAFVLVCIAVRRVVPLAAAAAAASHADALALHALLADTVMGQTGLCAVFEDAFADDMVAQVALAHCLVRSAAALCEAAPGSSAIGANGFARAARHLLCAAAASLVPKSVSAAAVPTELVSRAAHAAFRAARAVRRGELSERDMAAACAALALVCVRLRPFSHSSYPSSHKKNNRKSYRRKMRVRSEWRNWRAGVAGTRMRLRASLLRPGGRALTAMARDSLPDHHSRAEIIAFLRAGAQRGRRRRRSHASPREMLREDLTEKGGRRESVDEGGGPRFFSVEESRRIDATGDDRQALHCAALRAGADDSALRGELVTLVRTLPANRAARVPLLARRGAGLRPSALGLGVYAAALCRVERWDVAVALLRDAAVHAETTERDVLTALLLPVLRASVRSGRADAGHALLRHWEEVHSPDERDKQWEALHIRALSALRDGRALGMCVRFIETQRRSCASEQGAGEHVHNAASFSADDLDALLCDVSVAHADWRQAFDAIVSLCGSPPAPYSPRVATAAMLLLCRAPRNLSSTALRVRAGQGAAWGVANAGRLVLLLARQRRWQAALAHLAEMLPAVDRADAAGAARERATLLLHGLRACAIGGRGEEAAALYDRMKSLAEARPVGESEKTRRPAAQMEALMDALLDPAVSPAGAEDEDLRPIVAQARLYFIRAMTKKDPSVGNHQTDDTAQEPRGRTLP